MNGCFVYIAIYRLICIAPLVDRSKAQVSQGELDDRSLGLRGSCIAPLAYAVAQGELDDRSLGLRGFFSHAQNLKSRLYGLNGPPSSSRGWRGRGKSRRLRGMERFVEGVVAKCMKQMTTAYIVRATEC